MSLVTADSLKNEKQLFVRNLSYQTTGDDLALLFQDFGPLKHTSIVQENGVSKGFGFVKFALETDAAVALDKLQGHLLHGRKIKLELGVKKERSTKQNTSMDTPVNDQPNSTSQPLEQTVTLHTKSGDIAVADKTSKPVNIADNDSSDTTVKKSRQILVFGIPVDINKKAFKLTISKISRKADVELIKEENELSSSLFIINPPGKIMMITAVSRVEAAKLLKALDGASVNSLEIRKHMIADKTQSDSAVAKNKKEKLVARTLADMTDIEYRKRKCRVIIRNLSFQAIEQNIVDKMSKFGPLVSVEMPRTIIEKTNSNRRKNKANGVASNEEESPDMPADNQVLRPKGFGFVTFLCETDAKKAVEDSAGLRVCNREVAIDFCMNKESYTKYGIKDTDDVETDEVDGGSKDITSQDNDTSAGNGSDEDDEDEDDKVHSDADDSGGEDDNDNDSADGGINNDKENTKTATKTVSDDVQEGCTVFVRGLPFDADTNDLKSAMRKFGRIVLALVVKDKLTDVSKGSAFVKFSSADEAAACIAECGPGLIVKDRLCKINLAVDRESAQKLKTEDRGGKDKRNLYLANEGLIVPKEGSKDKNTMSEADKEKRQRAQNEKRKKLQNPLFFVSGNRLSIRNLGKDVTDNELKISCLKAVKAAIDRSLVTKDDLENHMKAQGSATTVTLDIPPMNSKTCVKSAKVMLDLTRVRSGIPQSRGYGFVEFTHHAHALGCLRELNNSGKYSDIASTGSMNGEQASGKGKLIVEFSLENIQKVKILRERESRQKQYKASVDVTPAPKKSNSKATDTVKSETTDNVSKSKPSTESVVIEKKNQNGKRKNDDIKTVTVDDMKKLDKEADKPEQQAKKQKQEVKAPVIKVPVEKVQQPSSDLDAAVAATQKDKKLKRGELQKKRKMEHKAAKRLAIEANTTAVDTTSNTSKNNTDKGNSNGSTDGVTAEPVAKKSRVEKSPTPVVSTTESSPAPKTEGKTKVVSKDKKSVKDDKKSNNAKDADTVDKTQQQQKPWGGHKRLRNEKKKTSGGAGKAAGATTKKK